MGLGARGQAIVAAAAIIAVGLLDYWTGPEVGFSLFYLVPIVWSGWKLDQTSSLVLALLAAISWMGADFSWNGVNAVSLWNGFTRLGIYVAIALLTSRVRVDQRQLQALNARLQELLNEEQLVARTDALTGLPNRRLFIDALIAAIDDARRAGDPLAAAYIDLNGFKRINDRFGHSGGDEMLRLVGQTVAADLPDGYVAARLGGDEFGILLRRRGEPDATAFAVALHERIKRAIANGRFAGVDVSIGVACFDEPPVSADAIIDHADAAMYCAKARHGQQVYVVRIPAVRPAVVHPS